MLFIVITNCQLDLPVDLETSAAHSTLFWAKHIEYNYNNNTIYRDRLCRATGHNLSIGEDGGGLKMTIIICKRIRL